jgi:hypothetical protein
MMSAGRMGGRGQRWKNEEQVQDGRAGVESVEGVDGWVGGGWCGQRVQLQVQVQVYMVYGIRYGIVDIISMVSYGRYGMVDRYGEDRMV